MYPFLYRLTEISEYAASSRLSLQKWPISSKLHRTAFQKNLWNFAITASNIKPLIGFYVLARLSDSVCESNFDYYYYYYYYYYCGPGNSVGMATDYGLDGPGSNRGVDEIFRLSRPALEPTQPPVKWVPGLSRR